MSKGVRALHFCLFLSVLISLNWVLTNTFNFPSGDKSIWFHGGLLMIVIGEYWVEPFFTKPSDVVVNSLVAFISISSLNNPPLAEWWMLLKWLTVLICVISFLVVLTGKKSAADTPKYIKFIYQLSTRVGSARILFSAIFLLSLISYFDLSAPSTKYFAICWFVILISKELRLDQLIEILLTSFQKQKFRSIGKVSRFFEPNIVRFSIWESAECLRGDLVAFTKSGELDNLSPIAYVNSHRRTIGSLEAEAVIIHSEFKAGTFDERQEVIKFDQTSESIKELLASNIFYKRLPRKIGYASKESDIGKLTIEITGSNTLEEGQLVEVCTRNKEIYYQITNAFLKEDKTFEKSERAFTLASAVQLGTWNSEKGGFEAYSWVAPENAPVFQVTPDENVAIIEARPLQSIGHIPNSSFPVGINVSDFILYHSAILGVTGAGKSYLAFDLIERAANANNKVICLDVTGDYKRHLGGCVILPTPAAVKPFLESPEGPRIGIIEFSDTSHPVEATSTIAKIMLKWCRENRTDDDFINPTSKALLVLEEAHNLVPEWNFNPQRDLQNVVNQTAQVVLQARKYGLGVCVVTQRTANVTKSILNQCNTIFSFQAFDETGYDFLKNYMGKDYVEMLPNLKARHGILVGKASNSSKPLIVRFNDQNRVLQNIEPPIWMVAKKAAAIEERDSAEILEP